MEYVPVAFLSSPKTTNKLFEELGDKPDPWLFCMMQVQLREEFLRRRSSFATLESRLIDAVSILTKFTFNIFCKRFSKYLNTFSLNILNILFHHSMKLFDGISVIFIFRFL